MRKQYLKFFYKSALLAFPVLIILGAYIYLDPFKVVRHYDSYYPPGTPSYVTLNRDYVSTQTYLNNSKKYNYNAFIFGNSTSRFYQINTWEKYIHTDNCFHFDAFNESLWGIYQKMKFLNKYHVTISYALIILDNSTLSQIKEKTGHLFMSHPALIDGSWFSFELEFFKTFLSRDFFKAYCDFMITHKIKDYMKNDHLLNDVPIEYIGKYNEMQFKHFDDLIKTDPAKFYTPKTMQFFYKRDTTYQKYWTKVISDTQHVMLQEMADILKNDKSQFKVVIGPLYNQLKIDSTDLKALYAIFGKENVYDFSGINSITNDFHNYYDNTHYRPPVADYLMAKMYGNK